MFIVAGLSPATHTRAVAELESRFPNAKVVGASSADGKAELYPEHLCATISKAATEFIIRRRADPTAQTTSPRYILLLYVPAPDSERLLRSFDFAVMAEPLSALWTRDERGVQLRSSHAAVKQALHDAVDPSGRAVSSINLVVERLSRLSDSEALLLPPRNFQPTGRPLSQIFRDFRDGARAWDDRIPELGPSELTHRDIERIPAGKTRRAFIDGRGVAYLTAHQTAFHAHARQVEGAATEESRLSVLRTLYRFGGPLESGFHHDAQPSDGSSFQDYEFECDLEGRVAITGSHANVYPNDYVRAARKQKI